MIKSGPHIVAERELYKEGRDVLEGEVRDLNRGGMESFEASDSTGNTMDILGDSW